MDKYEAFIASKRIAAAPCGFEPEDLPARLMDFQRDITGWDCRRGRAANFLDCGMGKTFIQLAWGQQVYLHRRKAKRHSAVLILAPLAVAEQTAREGEKFGIPVTVCESQDHVRPGINITNYQKLHKFDPTFAGIVLDESSILKAFDGKTKTKLMEFSANIPYKLCCTATPSPNDHMELGNHAEFLGVMSMSEMLATFFIHDGGDTSKWRLKGHAVSDFWKWVASWAVAIRKPSDLGYDDSRFTLPELRMHQITVDSPVPEGQMFAGEGKTLNERRVARKDSLEDRVRACTEIAAQSPDQFLAWCNLNSESEALTAAIKGAVEVAGSTPDERKRAALLDFAQGIIPALVTKPSIGGYGMNWQSCHRVAFVGLSDSFEQFYQAIRRCWRFGQQHPVDCYVITSEAEGAVVRNIQRKEEQANEMAEGMIEHMAAINRESVVGQKREDAPLEVDAAYGKGWQASLGDSVKSFRDMEENSGDFVIYSPPFASLYTYTSSDRDMGNCKSMEEFMEHYRFLVPELYRTLKPGRLLSFHCMNLPTTKVYHGYIGLQDFRGELIRIHQDAGFIYHSEVCIWKDPVTAMQRTKAIGLLHKQVKKDSAMSRQGIPDYLVTMRKPGVNTNPVVGEFDRYIGEDGTGPTESSSPTSFSIEVWQRYASPVWMDINPSDTLQKESAREEEDEKHICPLQLGVIRRAIELWTNPGDLVRSPFMGIGSEGFVAVQEGRRFEGVELKRSYYEQAVKNLTSAALSSTQVGLFDEAEETA